MSNETIAALATPPGRGGIGIVRVSGPGVTTIATALLGDLPPPRKAVLRHFRDVRQQSIDEGVALYFPAPHSFTGEDILELQGHGGPVVMDMLLAEVCQLGARPARPGEFSERAFMNDRIDLAQAEAIADLIDSGSSQAARAALRSLDGEFSRQVQALAEEMLRLRIYVEAAIDFPEEEIDFLAADKVHHDVEALSASLQALMANAQQGCVLREGLVLVIAGLPNAGKSSLLNALAARDTAIVTEIPGTTRDILRETIQIDGLPLQIIDTAGLREAGDIVEQEGIRRAWQEIERADRILFVVDDQEGMTAGAKRLFAQLPEGLPVTMVHNKIDLSRHAPGMLRDEQGEHSYISARGGLGIDSLKTHLKDCAGYRETTTDTFSARRRHLDALRRARELVEHGQQQLAQAQAGELLAEDLRQAHQALGEITGECRSDDLLGAIFSSFCIGK
ncbi:tRNA uridine-5-carboxymethylaminomethyl(34) synthesis GTPase MnmE [Sulfuriflexus sp.]|uniref:tRNA uridine-5-carboxymethylaminomethyl(34) synthesis GTPase MnmE n=1 Tax=Sulfuriflexus sp. TaxID=2015443 RepID=UPI0028CE1327|nr:tRNA uridine-5-carboxymethylaminomethyl(34) synthesis GTPase MnmE [Sulfuriflexus sp.]MDT8404093.1 tRNA uridine-5-carboxymethylaminomethyl(34) synthesis GTPase MnmE [Sulfuriflexus sp.]